LEKATTSGTSQATVGSASCRSSEGVWHLECTQTRVVMLFSIKKCKRLLKYCWRQPELGRPWQIPLVQFAFSAIALCAWISAPKELVCALFALVFLGVVEAIQLVVVCPNHPHISCGTTKTAMKEGGTTCCWRMVLQRKWLKRLLLQMQQKKGRGGPAEIRAPSQETKNRTEAS